MRWISNATEPTSGAHRRGNEALKALHDAIEVDEQVEGEDGDDERGDEDEDDVERAEEGVGRPLR